MGAETSYATMLYVSDGNTTMTTATIATICEPWDDVMASWRWEPWRETFRNDRKHRLRAPRRPYVPRVGAARLPGYRRQR